MKKFEQQAGELITAFEEKREHSFKIFTEIWETSKLRETLKEDSQRPRDEIAHEVQHFFYTFEETFNSPFDMHQKSGILFLMYMIYATRKQYQPFKFMLKYDDYECLDKFIKYCHKEKIVDSLFIFYKLKLDDAFTFYYGTYLRLPGKKVKLMANWKNAKNIYATTAERLGDLDDKYKSLLKKYIPDSEDTATATVNLE